MNTQQNQNDIKKKGVHVNPSRDIKYDDKEKTFSGEFEEQIESAGQEVNPGELDTTEVDLDRGSKEFSGGDDAFDTAVKNAGSKGSAQGYEGNSPDIGITPDLGGDVSQVSGQGKTEQKGQGDQLH